jgi:hypothetical protein
VKVSAVYLSLKGIAFVERPLSPHNLGIMGGTHLLATGRADNSNGCIWPNPAVELSIAGCQGRKIAECHEGPGPTQSRLSSLFKLQTQARMHAGSRWRAKFQANFKAARVVRYCCRSRKRESPRVPHIVTDSSSLALKPPFVIFAEPITAVYLSPLSK